MKNSFVLAVFVTYWIVQVLTKPHLRVPLLLAGGIAFAWGAAYHVVTNWSDISRSLREMAATIISKEGAAAALFVLVIIAVVGTVWKRSHVESVNAAAAKERQLNKAIADIQELGAGEPAFETLEELLNAAEDSDPRIRMEAATSLGLLARHPAMNFTAVADILQKLREMESDDEASEVRYKASIARELVSRAIDPSDLPGFPSDFLGLPAWEF